MKKSLAGIFVAVVCGSAQAQWAVYDFKVDQGVRAVVDAVRASAQTATSMQMRAAEQISNSVNLQNTELAKLRVANGYMLPDPCSAVAGTAGTSAANRTASPHALGSGRDGAPRVRRTGNPTLNKVLDVAQGKAPPEDPVSQSVAGFAAACQSFASPGNYRADACEQAGLKPGEKSLKLEPDADIKASTLFDGPMNKGEAFRKKLTINFDGQEPASIAVEAYAVRLNTPVELGALRATELKTDEGRRYMNFKDTYDARMSLGEEPVRRLILNRSANPNTIKVIRQLLVSDVTSSHAQQYLAEHYPNWEKTGISNDELMNLQVELRYMNIDWYRNMANVLSDPAQKEIINMMAFDQTMRWRQLQELQTMNVLLGQLVSTSVRQEMTPQLNALHEAALR